MRAESSDRVSCGQQHREHRNEGEEMASNISGIWRHRYPKNDSVTADRSTTCLLRENTHFEFTSGAYALVNRRWYPETVMITVVSSNGRYRVFTRPRIWYDASETSNPHFSGPCWKTLHYSESRYHGNSTFVQVHRTQIEAMRFLSGRAELSLV